MTKKPKQPRRSRKPTKWVLAQRHIAGEPQDNLDPFDISPDIIPVGTTYQWCTWTVLGEIGAFFDQEQWAKKGWKHVPASRHPGAPKDKKGNIYSRGQMLMQRPLKVTQAAQAKEYARAIGLLNDEREHLQLKPAGPFPLIPSDKLSTWSPKLDDRPLEPTLIEATINIMLTTREVEIAHACCMTNERYAHAKLALLMSGAFNPAGCSALVPSTDRKTFAFAGIAFTVNPQ